MHRIFKLGGGVDHMTAMHDQWPRSNVKPKVQRSRS